MGGGADDAHLGSGLARHSPRAAYQALANARPGQKSGHRPHAALPHAHWELARTLLGRSLAWVENGVNQRQEVLTMLALGLTEPVPYGPQGGIAVVLLFWGGIGVVLGVLAYGFLRSRGEQGYQVFGEIMLGMLGSLSLAMTVGVVAGWGQIFTRSGNTTDLIMSGVTALIGGLIVLGVMLYLTLRSSPVRDQDRPAG